MTDTNKEDIAYAINIANTLGIALSEGEAFDIVVYCDGNRACIKSRVESKGIQSVLKKESTSNKKRKKIRRSM